MNISITPLQTLLKKFARSNEFSRQIAQVFGEGNDYILLQQLWLDENITVPTMEIISSSQINGANGGYAPATETIYISQELVDSGDTESITRVLLEEYGHYLNDYFNMIILIQSMY